MRNEYWSLNPHYFCKIMILKGVDKDALWQKLETLCTTDVAAGGKISMRLPWNNKIKIQNCSGLELPYRRKL